VPNSNLARRALALGPIQHAALCRPRISAGDWLVGTEITCAAALDGHDFHRYVEARHATGTQMEELARPVVLAMRYDVPAWLAHGAPIDTGAFRLDVPGTFVFRLSPEGERELESALKVWTPRAIGLSKLITRIRYSAQLRDCARAFEPAAAAGMSLPAVH
jgi:hypothetical protein